MEGFKERFVSIFADNVKREGSTELLNWLEHSDFFYAPASTKFHGSEEGGLLKHSLNVYDCLIQRLKSDPDVCTEESAAITALLHDVCKVNFYKKDSRNVKENGVWVQKDVFVIDEKCPAGYHADKSIILIQQFMKLTMDEIFAIRAHMGGWDEACAGGARFPGTIFERCRLAVHLHIADIEASYLIESR